MRTFRALSVLTLALLGSAAGAASAAARAPGAAPGAATVDTEVKVGQLLRAALLRGLNGPDRQLAEFRGRPLLINVWASWCGPCRAEMASLERVAWREEGRQFAIIGISTDDYRDQALAWLTHSNATISHYLDQQLQMEHMLGATRLPLTLIVDASGRVRLKVYGAREWDAPESLALVRSALAEPPLHKQEK
jgi:thiol-disulfide isomerase/thioredoxin